MTAPRHSQHPVVAGSTPWCFPSLYKSSSRYSLLPHVLPYPVHPSQFGPYSFPRPPYLHSHHSSSDTPSPSYSSSRFITRPEHFVLFSCTFPDISPTFVVSRIRSFRIPSSFVPLRCAKRGGVVCSVQGEGARR